MEMKYSEEDKYFLAKKKVGDIKGFYGNLASYVFVNAILIFVNLYTSPEYLWFLWCIMGWGIGVIFHGLKVFGISPFFNKEWEERKIKELMEKEKNNKWE